MSKKPDFEVVPNHEFKVNEKIYLIDTNGYDLSEAKIHSVDGTKYTVRLEEDRKKTIEVEGTERLLTRSKTNNKIFKDQEYKRNTKESSDAEESQEDDSEEEGVDFEMDDDEPAKKKSKKPSKTKKNAKSCSKNRPCGARCNPKRGSA